MGLCCARCGVVGVRLVSDEVDEADDGVDNPWLRKSE